MRRDPSGIPSFLDGGGGGGNGRSIQDQLGTAPGPLLFMSLLFLQGGGMDLSRVEEKILSSVRSARSPGLLPSSPFASDRSQEIKKEQWLLTEEGKLYADEGSPGPHAQGGDEWRSNDADLGRSDVSERLWGREKRGKDTLQFAEKCILGFLSRASRGDIEGRP